MCKTIVMHRMSLMLLAGFLCLLLLAACGSNATVSSSTTTSTKPAANTSTSNKSAEQALLPMMTLVGQPTAKLITGHHTFQVSGTIKNGDTKQHDIYIQATLLDASGAIIGSTAFFNVDNVHGGSTASFAVTGTTMQPTWSRIQVNVVGISENIGNSGGD